ncbi:MAG: hypothetical protein JOZ72_11905 [Alphaproteobacteria bacterium]|nr:hypothetical protein [Alphaproteobacteria bacterium]
MRFAILAAALAVSAPALADPADYTAPDRQASYAAGSDLIDTPGAHPQLDACERLMERAFYLPDPGSLERAMDARHEMELARDAFHEGNEFACKRHAIHALEDRT